MPNIQNIPDLDNWVNNTFGALGVKSVSDLVRGNVPAVKAQIYTEAFVPAEFYASPERMTAYGTPKPHDVTNVKVSAFDPPGAGRVGWDPREWNMTQKTGFTNLDVSADPMRVQGDDGDYTPQSIAKGPGRRYSRPRKKDETRLASGAPLYPTGGPGTFNDPDNYVRIADRNFAGNGVIYSERLTPGTVAPDTVGPYPLPYESGDVARWKAAGSPYPASRAYEIAAAPIPADRDAMDRARLTGTGGGDEPLLEKGFIGTFLNVIRFVVDSSQSTRAKRRSNYTATASSGEVGKGGGGYVNRSPRNYVSSVVHSGGTMGYETHVEIIGKNEPGSYS